MCSGCRNKVELGSFTYLGQTKYYPSFSKEMCRCNNCGSEFLLRYNLFNGERHIISDTFSSDVNDLTQNWVDKLSEDQRKSIEGHLKKCPQCRESLEEETLRNAWFSAQLRNPK